jgi:phosphate transport system ATP-binding protein
MSKETSKKQKRRPEEIAVSMQNVTISYGNSAAVRDVFCDISRGKVTALLGLRVAENQRYCDRLIA